MNWEEIYGGAYLKAEDLKGQATRVVIERVDPVEFPGKNGSPPERKAALTFRGRRKRLALNNTNYDMMKALFGSNDENWLNREIELYIAKVPFEGRIVDSIRIRAPLQDAAAQPISQAKPTAPTPVATAPAVATPAAGVVTMDDDIPW